MHLIAIQQYGVTTDLVAHRQVHGNFIAGIGFVFIKQVTEIIPYLKTNQSDITNCDGNSITQVLTLPVARKKVHKVTQCAMNGFDQRNLGEHRFTHVE